jgi:Zn-dependent peptidase ImmA (M78 family)/transcriptional regulator with XRE-family HTH domain
MMNYAELGRRIRLARETASLSQDDVAKHLELSRSAISLIEGGKRKVDSLELQKFSNLVGKSIEEFFAEEVNTNTSDDPSFSANIKESSEFDPTQILFSANQAVDISPDRDQIKHFREFHKNFGNLARMLNRIPDPYSTEPFYNVYKPTPAAAKWMATKERARLGLPSSVPVGNMSSILESQGVRVMAWPLKTPKLSGCFIFSPSLGSFVLVKSNLKASSANMLNFVLAHEYCHHLIHRQQRGIACDLSNYRKPEEYFSQWFAANFLMPEEALVPRLMTYLKKTDGEISAEIVMHLALDFGVSYTAMLNRMADKRVELIDKNTRKKFSQSKPALLLAQIGRSVPPLIKPRQFPLDYENMAFEAYGQSQIDLDKLAQLLEISLQEAKTKAEERSIVLNLGVKSESELWSDIENA